MCFETKLKELGKTGVLEENFEENGLVVAQMFKVSKTKYVFADHLNNEIIEMDEKTAKETISLLNF